MKLFICLLAILATSVSTEASGVPHGSSTICDLEESSTTISINQIDAYWMETVDATAVRAAAIRMPLEEGCEIDFKAVGQYLAEVRIKLRIANSNFTMKGSYKSHYARPDSAIHIFDPYTRSVESTGSDLFILLDFKSMEGMFVGVQIGVPHMEMMRHSSDLRENEIDDVEIILKDRILISGLDPVPVTVEVSRECTTEPLLYLLPCEAPVILSLDESHNRTTGEIDIICKAVSIDGSPGITWMLIQDGADDIPQTNISLITETRDQLTTTSTLHNVTAGNETVTYSCVAQNNNSGGGRAKREIHITASEATTESSTATKTLLWGIVGAAVGAVAAVTLGCVGLTKGLEQCVKRRKKGEKQKRLEIVEDHVDLSSSDDLSWRTLSPVEPTYAEVTRKERPDKPHSPNIYHHLDPTMRTTSRDDFRTYRPPPKPPTTLAPRSATLAPRPAMLAPAPIREYEMEATSFGSTSEGHYEMQSLRL